MARLSAAKFPAPKDTTDAVASTRVKKRGPESWLQGTKLAFLSSLEDEWTAAQKTGPTQLGTFCDRVTTQWLYMYGYDLPLTEDNPNHAAVPDTGLDKVPGLEDQPPEVIESRHAYWKTLRQVSCSLSSKSPRILPQSFLRKSTAGFTATRASRRPMFLVDYRNSSVRSKPPLVNKVARHPHSNSTKANTGLSALRHLCLRLSK